MKEFNSHTDNDTYLAYWLEGKLSDEELQTLVSESDFNTYVKLHKGIEVYARLEQPLNASYNNILAEIENKENSGIVPLKSMLKWAIAASLVLFLGVYFGNNLRDTSVETAISEQRNFDLIDGTEIVLNANSEISYNENSWKKERRVSLDGEAYFKVAKGSTFDVHTNNGIVTVLGTQFSVNSTSDYFEVICYEGKVRVTKGDATIVLTPGEVFRKINGNAIEELVTINSEPAWLHGESEFKSVPLKYVIVSLEKQYNLQFDTSQIDVQKIFTGSFSHKDINIALAAVFKTMGITYLEVNPKKYRLIYME